MPGVLDVGRYPGGTDATSHAVAAAFRDAGFVSEPRPDVMAWKHRKLMMNLGNAVQACCAPGPDADDLAGRAVAEGETALAAAGSRWSASRGTASGAATCSGSARWPGANGRGGSTWQSLRRGTGSLETDYLNGEVVRLGRLHGVPTPANALLQATARRLAAAGGEPGSVRARDLLAQLA